MGPKDLQGCEEIALWTYELAGLCPDVPASPGLLCQTLHGCLPERVEGLPRESLMTRVGGHVRILVRADVSTERGRVLAFHELAHTLLDPSAFETHEDLEAGCDLLGSCLAAPRPAFERLTSRLGHRVYDLAAALRCTQAMAMLRIGEVHGRPVRLLAKRERTRGAAFDWPDTREALRGLHRSRVHPIWLADEKRWGLMAAGGGRLVS